MSKLRVFQVMGTPQRAGEPPPIEELELVTLAAEGDQAKRAARTHLEEVGFAVRSINWGPDAQGNPQLIAYVTKGT